jgi:hypothetical protein
MVAIVAQGGIRGNECKTLLRLTQSGSHQLEIMEAHFAHISSRQIRGKFTLHQWNVDKFMSFFLRALRAHAKLPLITFSYLEDQVAPQNSIISIQVVDSIHIASDSFLFVFSALRNS